MYAIFAHDRLFRKKSSHGSMLAYFMLHLQVGIRTQTRTEIAIQSKDPGWANMLYDYVFYIREVFQGHLDPSSAS